MAERKRARRVPKGAPIGVEPDATFALRALAACLDQYAGRYHQLRGVWSFGAYVEQSPDRADEELLTEPVLDDVLQRVLGFPKDAYFPQLGRGGLKPDFTPIDLIAHPFVLDAKGSDQANLAQHEAQIRRYVDQRGLDYGVLFNLREMRVYRRARHGHDPALSFRLLPLWRLIRGEAMPGPDLAAFMAFRETFAFREMPTAAKIGHLRSQRSWDIRAQAGEDVRVDVEFLTERLRRLSHLLTEDAHAQQDRLLRHVRQHPGREDPLLQELRLLALDVSPGARIEDLPDTAAGWAAAQDGLAHRVWRQYLLRVAYLALTRILLYRAWEDVGFVDGYLYDGGFDVAYARLHEDTQRVLTEAFMHGAERYPWLFGADNNYDWYRPREEALVEVLYSLGQFPLGRLDADVLGGLYQSYVDEIDRDRLGQFFTPRAVVRFMLDRAGFAGGEVFRVAGDERLPKRVFDFATGSGGFLVEAARRIIDDAGVDHDDPRALEEALDGIVGGLVGSEISPFPYYLTEVNLLLQVSRLLGRLHVLGDDPGTFTLGVLHMDSLAARAPEAVSLEGLAPGQRADRAEIERDERFGLVPLDGDKRATYRGLRGGMFDLVVGNPPYVAEANNRVLFERLRELDGWKGVYRGKTDYLYYFLLLALEKTAPGGRLCVITPASWMNAGAAGFLRERLAAELRLDELFLFGAHPLFAPDTPERRRRVPTPTVESAILVATRAAPPPRHRLRVVALTDEPAAVAAFGASRGSTAVDRDRLLEAMAARAGGRPGTRDGITVLDVPQRDLRADRPWPVKHGKQTVAARVVAALDAAESDGASCVEPLTTAWNVFQGIQTGADAWTKRIDRRLSAEDRQRLHAAGAAMGDPILELPPGAETQEPWRSHPGVLARAPEPTGILYGACDLDDRVSLVVLRREAPDAVVRHLERWRPLLETRAEIARNPRRRWWETAWPRDERQMRAPKVISLHRTHRGRFALDEAGELQPSIKTTVVTGKADHAPVAYLCGLLNSELLDLWYAVRGRTPRDVWRDYEPRAMNQIPYRRPEGDPRAGEVADLVRLIGLNRLELLPYRARFPELTGIVKDPWNARRPAPDLHAVMAALPVMDTISVRLDGRLTTDLAEAPFGRARRTAQGEIVFTRGRRTTGRIAGPPDLLDLLEPLLRGAEDPHAVLLPKDPDALHELVSHDLAEIARLLDGGRRMVERVERLVCALYGIPDDLTEEVVRHASDRAGERSDNPIDEG